MNDFIARKLGEVLAFARVGHEILQTTESTLEAVFRKEALTHALAMTKKHQELIEEIAINEKIESIVHAKADGTSETLRKMASLYIGEKWAVPAEILEWHGFFEGAAIVHWNLILGAAATQENDALSLLAFRGLRFHEDFLRIVSEKLKEIGIQKSST